jgi:hypothetical protein
MKIICHNSTLRTLPLPWFLRSLLFARVRLTLINMGKCIYCTSTDVTLMRQHFLWGRHCAIYLQKSVAANSREAQCKLGSALYRLTDLNHVTSVEIRRQAVEKVVEMSSLYKQQRPPLYAPVQTFEHLLQSHLPVTITFEHYFYDP